MSYIFKDVWNCGDIQALLNEGKCIQKRLGKVISSSSTDSDAIGRTFRDLTLNGKVQSALRYLSRTTNGGAFKLEDLVPEK